MKISELIDLIGSDLARYRKQYKAPNSLYINIRLLFIPSVIGVILYRVSRFFYLNKMKPLAWLTYNCNITLTGAEILPYTSIGRSFMLAHPVGIIIAGKVGNNVTFFCQGGMGGGMEGDNVGDDVGAGPGLPVIEDNVIIGASAVILGPVVIGKNAKISPCAFVNKDVPPGATAVGNPCRIIKAAEKVETEKTPS